MLAFKPEAEGYDVDKAYSAEDALTRDLAGYDLILLDIMMGEISGIQLAKIMKANQAMASVPIIFCTAKAAEEDMIRGLDLGADDYIAKPYSLNAMLARIRAVLRRAGASSPAAAEDTDGVVAFGGLRLSSRTRVCTVDGVEVRMPRKEFEILYKLLANRGQVFSRAHLRGGGGCGGPRDRCQYHPYPPEDRPVRAPYRHPFGLRLRVCGIGRVSSAGGRGSEQTAPPGVFSIG